MPRPRSCGEHDARRAQDAARTVQMLNLDSMGVQEDAFAPDQFNAVATSCASRNRSCAAITTSTPCNRADKGASPLSSTASEVALPCMRRYRSACSRKALLGMVTGEQAGAAHLRFALDHAGAKNRLWQPGSPLSDRPDPTLNR